jgi:hypothetical protein
MCEGWNDEFFDSGMIISIFAKYRIQEDINIVCALTIA